MKLRPYQEECTGAIWDYFIEGNAGNPVVAAPTGTGKSLIIAGFIKSIYDHFPRQRVMILTHVKELIEQNYAKLNQYWPTAPSGIYSSGVGRKDTYAKITFGGIQTVVNCPDLFGHIDLVIIDECHLVSPNENTSYRKFIDALREVNPALKVVGLSATPYRMKTGMITDGGLFTDICIDLTSLERFNQFIYDGYLCPLIPKHTNQQIDLTDVKLVAGEFANKELQSAVDREEITYHALREAMAFGAERKKWLIFATGIEHAHHIVDMLESFGVAAAVVHSKMAASARKEVLRAFRNGEFQAIVNNNVLTTGFDDPEIDMIVMLRPTNSPGLWVQMLGRGTRPVYAPGYDLETREGRLNAIGASGKQNCLVLDFAGNTGRLGPINDPVIPNPRSKKKKGGVAPVKLCEGCGTYNHASVRACVNCGEEFSFTVKFGVTASTDQVLADGMPQVETFRVDRVVYNKHSKKGRPDSIKVSYFCGLRVFNSFVCLEHGRFPGKRAREFWRDHWPHNDWVPDTTESALHYVDRLKEPTTIRVWVNKKHPEVMSYEF